MTNGAGFKVYKGQPVMGVFPLVVLTTGITGFSKLFSEYFVFMNDDECSYFPRRFLLNESKEVAQTFGIDEAYMTGHALSCARSTLSDYLYKKYKSTGERIYVEKDFVLKEEANSTLIQLYLTGTFTKQYEKMQRQTESNSLREFIAKILKLPKIVETKLDE
jgi:hypothetical protein